MKLSKVPTEEHLKKFYNHHSTSHPTPYADGYKIVDHYIHKDKQLILDIITYTHKGKPPYQTANMEEIPHVSHFHIFGGVR